MIDEIEMVESVSSAAVVSANEFLEDYLMNILLSAAQEADKENVGTIKIRHLSTVASSSPTINQTHYYPALQRLFFNIGEDSFMEDLVFFLPP